MNLQMFLALKLLAKLELVPEFFTNKSEQLNVKERRDGIEISKNKQ